jgi:hypothetical protein
MKGRLLDFSFGYNRKQRVTIELDSDFREGFDTLKGSDLEISIKKWRPRRSNDANKYFHLLVNEIAAVKGLEDDEVKIDLVTRYGTYARDDDGMIVGFKLPASVDASTIYPYTRMYKEVEEDGKLFKCYLVYKQTRLMDSAEMAHLIDGAVREAQDLGIDTDTPEQKTRYSEN